MSNNVKPDPKEEYPNFFAILPNGKEIAPSSFSGGFHGTKLFPPSQVFMSGFPSRGDNRNLLEHIQGAENSAFRGSTNQVLTLGNQGAAEWASEGGWVYQIEAVPTWDVDKELQGQVPRPGGFGDTPLKEELELAIPARIREYRIVRAGQVVLGRGSRLTVKTWNDNPNC